MALHVLKRGLDIPIKGEATGQIQTLDAPKTVAYSPTELKGIVPRLAAKEGDRVDAGAPLFYDKRQPDMKFLSPVAGRVKEVRRGRRRVITDVVVQREEGGAQSFRSWELSALESISREEARAQLAAGGLWGCLRTRPLDAIPTLDSEPQSILISATETGPLMPGPDVLLAAEDAEALQAGVRVLAALGEGRVHLAVSAGSSHPALANVRGVEQHQFGGPHPSGDAAVQVNLVDPPRGGQQVWTIAAWDVVLIGRLFLEGRFPSERVYAAVGTEVVRPRVVRTLLGAPLRHIVGESAEGARWIRGSVLTGEAVDAGRWASYTVRGVHLIPDEAERKLFGWTMPRLGDFSFHRAFLSGFTGGSGRYRMHTGTQGGVRTIIPVGYYEKVVATPDIMPEFLFRAIVAGDLEEAMNLGLLDLSMEEAALCTYLCPSKMEFDVLLREGLEMYEKEA